MHTSLIFRIIRKKLATRILRSHRRHVSSGIGTVFVNNQTEITTPKSSQKVGNVCHSKPNLQLERYQLKKLHKEHAALEREVAKEQRQRSLHSHIMDCSLNNDGHALIQRLQRDLKAKRENVEALGEGLKVLGKMFQISSRNPEVADHALFFSAINVINLTTQIDANIGAGLLYLLLSLEKWVIAQPSISVTDEIHEMMKATRNDVTKKVAGLILTNQFTLYTDEEREEMLQRLITLTKINSDPEQQNSPFGYDKKNSLLLPFGNLTPTESYQGNPYNFSGSKSTNELEALFRQQIGVEKSVWKKVENPTFNKDNFPISAEEFFSKCGWKECLASTLTESIKIKRKSFHRSLILRLGIDVVVESLLQSVLKVLSTGNSFVHQTEFNRIVVTPLLILLNRKYLNSLDINENELWDRMFSQYSRYFIDDKISHEYTHREWWEICAKNLRIPQNMDIYNEIVTYNVWKRSTVFFQKVIFEAISIKGEGEKTTSVFSIKNLAIDSESNFYVSEDERATLVPMIKLHHSLDELIIKYPFKEFHFNSQELPMLVPPKPWMDKGVGGPEYIRKGRIIRNIPELGFDSEKETQKRLLDSQQGRPVWDALNQLGSTPWKINQPLLTLLTEIFRKGDDPENAALLGKLSVPLNPETIRVPNYKEYFNDQRDEDITKEMWRKYAILKASRIKTRNETHGLRCYLLYRLAQAHHYSKQIIYFPHNMDFRGRVYPISPHLSHMGDDINRCILMFARGRKLGDNGLKWLKRHIINLTGRWKRSSTIERDQAADAHVQLMLDSANVPLAGSRWWINSDDPWQTLAACIELRDALNSGDPSSFVSHLPLHQDGSCNGLQHYAALGRDKQGGEEVNLLPSEGPNDVYSSVAKRVEQKRQEDEANPDAKDFQVAKLLREYLPQEVPRKVIKQTVMTTVYGVTMYGAVLQIKRQLKALDINDLNVQKFAMYLAEKTFASLHDAFTTSMELKNWFRKCAKGIAELHRTTEWVTPLGLPAVQPYVKVTEKHGFRYTSPISHKQISAFPPNYVHSLDSTHMMLTSLECARRGITFAAVHDCYWTHACSVDDMNVICRDTFVRLHSEPLIEQLSSSFGRLYLPKDLVAKMSPQEINYYEEIFKPKFVRGELDIESVRDSVYFFS